MVGLVSLPWPPVPDPGGSTVATPPEKEEGVVGLVASRGREGRRNRREPSGSRRGGPAGSAVAVEFWSNFILQLGGKRKNRRSRRVSWGRLDRGIFGDILLPPRIGYEGGLDWERELLAIVEQNPSSFSSPTPSPSPRAL